jgi:hypothetical protein
MLLQELIRNFALYKGVMKPFIESWKDSLVTLYTKQNYQYAYQIEEMPIPKSKKNRSRLSVYFKNALNISEFSLSDGTGTLTIAYVKSTNYDIFWLDGVENGREFAVTGNTVITMLIDGPCIDNLVISDKTLLFDTYTGTEYFHLSSLNTYSITTGFTTKNVCSMLISETHERREYLGEFLLPHEENPLLYQKKGGGKHEISKKSVTTSI